MPKLQSTTAKLPPVHPGEILRETLDDLGLSMNQLAHEVHVPPNRISAIVAAKRSITGETALRLARYFATTPAYWMNLQARFDLETARDVWEAKVEAEIRPRTAALTRAASSLTALRQSRRVISGQKLPVGKIHFT